MSYYLRTFFSARKKRKRDERGERQDTYPGCTQGTAWAMFISFQGCERLGTVFIFTASLLDNSPFDAISNQHKHTAPGHQGTITTPPVHTVAAGATVHRLIHQGHRDLRTPGSSSHNPAAAPRLVHHRLITRGCATNAPAYQNQLSCAAKRQTSPSLASTDKPRTLPPGLPRGHSPLSIGISSRPSSAPHYLITSRCQVPRRITRQKVNFTSQVPLRPATAQRALLPQVCHGKLPPTLPSPIQHAWDEHGSDLKEFFILICHIRIHLLVSSTAINFRHGFLVISTVANSTVNISLQGVTRQRPKSPEQNNPESQAPSRCVHVDGSTLYTV
ncbi:uncharacterized protein CLUP02_09469 [Colletotrichum lupini]|uniref:Uncharacterized protein n=1 Tax=Colletotrichum lupini TaxID=145971 RepID=A0A9Q8SVH4_9PEZI|nr:uncharacterized protein CLUP02_09469 [Colletotrichum lupini]UQC83973.1 hypothetical protein CLUP02_09469 [Colletotrichum lupini]